MPSPFMLSVFAGVTIATVLFFIFREHQESRRSYEHRPRQERQQQYSSTYQCHRQQPGNDDMCTICLESFSESDYLLLPCSHVFHKDCIQKLQTSSNMRALCPVCRSKIPIRY